MRLLADGTAVTVLEFIFLVGLRRLFAGGEMQPGEGPGQQMTPPPPPPQEEVAPPPQPPSNNVPPEANQKNGKGKHKKGNREEPAPCPEGMAPLDDGTCAVPQ